MATLTDISTLITTDPNRHSGRPIITGTGTSVRRIAGLYNQGNNAEEIARRLNHLTIPQNHADFTYYHANRDEIDKGIAAEKTAYQQLAKHNNQQFLSQKRTKFVII